MEEGREGFGFRGSFLGCSASVFLSQGMSLSWNEEGWEGGIPVGMAWGTHCG